MKCPFCQSMETKVIDSRLNQLGDLIRRRRHCNICGGRYTTYERIEEIMPNIIKKDGGREPYSRDKLTGGIQAACLKRPVTTQQIENIVSNIEKRVQAYGLKEIPSKAIGQMSMAALHQLDKVAYVRFASVYREFQDVDEFVAELQMDPLKNGPEQSMSFPFAADSDDHSSDSPEVSK